MPATLLTDARTAVWNSIDNWGPLQVGQESFIRKKYKFDTELSMLADASPAASDLNALAIFPSTTIPEPFTTSFKRYPYALDFFFWTRDWIVPHAERMWENIVDALYQAKASGETLSYIHAETCRRPKLGPITMERVKLSDEKVRAIKCRMQVILWVTFNPMS